MKPKTAEKSDSSHPKRQNESTRERVLEAAFTLFCEHAGKPAHLATRYFVILWDDLLIRLLMRLREPPTDDEIRERAHSATETLF